MSDQPTFTRGWRAAIAVSLVASFAAGGSATKLYEEQNRRRAALDESIKKIEHYLYVEVSNSKRSYEESERKNEQRIAELEKALRSHQ